MGQSHVLPRVELGPPATSERKNSSRGSRTMVILSAGIEFIVKSDAVAYHNACEQHY
jgi:hypothetical protein